MATGPGLLAGMTGVSNSDAETRVAPQLGDLTVPLPVGAQNALLGSLAPATAATIRISPDIIPRLVLAHGAALSADPIGPARDWFERFFVIFDGHAFGRLHERDLGYLLSNQEMLFEIWSTDRYAPHDLTGLTPTGPAGVTWVDPFGLPITFAALQAFQYQVQVRLAGAPQILNTLAVAFGALSGPDPTVSGLRVIPIPLSPNWESGFEEGPSYRTDIVTGSDGTEQRVMRRFKPRHRIRYDLLPKNDLELQLLEQLLWGWSRYAYGIPLWSDAVTLTTALSAGETTIPLDPSDRAFVVNGNVILIADAFTWEAAHLSEVNPGDLRIEDELQQSWPAYRTMVVPLYFGRLDPEMALDRPGPALAQMTISALCDPLGI